MCPGVESPSNVFDDDEGDEEATKWARCWNELESIGYPEEWSQGEASSPSRTPSPESVIADKMMGGKLWMKVPQLVLFIYTTYEEGPPTPHPPCAEAWNVLDAFERKESSNIYYCKLPLGLAPSVRNIFVVGTFLKSLLL